MRAECRAKYCNGSAKAFAAREAAKAEKKAAAERAKAEAAAAEAALRDAQANAVATAVHRERSFAEGSLGLPEPKSLPSAICPGG